MQLFLLAHQDDEYAMTSFLRAALRAGEDVRVIYLTDGGALSARRDKEALAALADLGVVNDRVIFLGSQEAIPDGRLYQNLDRAFAALMRALDGAPAPQAVFTHAWEGGHQDHDCVHALAVACAAARGWAVPIYQAPYYRELRGVRKLFMPQTPLAENGPVEQRGWSFADLTSAVRVMLRHRSQWRTFRTHGPAMFIRFLAGGGGGLQRARPARVRERPHTGPLYYERLFGLPYETVAAALTGFFDAHPEAGAPRGTVLAESPSTTNIH